MLMKNKNTDKLEALYNKIKVSSSVRNLGSDFIIKKSREKVLF